MSSTCSISGRRPTPGRLQQGTTLIEMLAGLTVGLLVTVTALTMLAFLQINASIQSDSFALQQRGDFALQAIGSQLRQAGAIELQAAGQGDAVRFSSAYSTTAVIGEDGTTDTVQISHQYAPGARDCLGNEPDPTQTGASVNSRFSVLSGQLRCMGSDTRSGNQVIADGVEDFQLRYGIRRPSALGPQFREEDAQTIGARWNEVGEVRVCLQLVGDLRRRSTLSPAQRDCQGRALPLDGRSRSVVHASFSLRNAAAI
jgi:type IV pilus assembly protein PilW